MTSRPRAPQPYAHDQDQHELHELRCLHELARQLLPLTHAEDIGRDGLLCIAGITGIGSGAVLWSATETAPLRLLAHFGLRGDRLPAETHVDADADRLLRAGGAMTLDACRRRAASRPVLASLAGFAEQFPDAWLLPLTFGQSLRGVLLLGPSLVTRQLLPTASLLVDLGETLSLALVGAPARGAAEVAAVPTASQPAEGDVRKRLEALRRRRPETRLLVGESAAILAVLEEIASLADTDYTVMIHGQTGTGKELAAMLLHRLSRRARGPFEAVDCSSIPRELIESELFGHVKGAFTGATRDFRGAFERADGGTLLLDEIGDMDLRSQTRLLRVLQEGKVRPLGGDQARTVNVRVVAATNKDLAAMVRDGTFREDLYYRIHVCPLWIPSLRERGDDRIVLFEHFMNTHAAELQRAPRTLVAAARGRIAREEFPGNVRQLQNVVRRLLVQGARGGPITAEELDRVLAQAAAAARPAPEISAGPAPSPSPTAAPTAVADVGAWVLERLRAHRFNLSAAAKELQEQRAHGVSRGAVPVFDRGALDYYLCGEFFEHLVASDFDVTSAVEQLAGSKALVARVRRKAEGFLRPLRDAASKQDLARARASFRRLPERYAAVLDRVCAAAEAGRLQG